MAVFVLVVLVAAAADALPQEASEETPDETAVERPPLAIPPGYQYDPAGRRDPFVNPVPPVVEDTGPEIPAVRPPGLPGVLLNEAQLVGVVTSAEPNMNVVLIQAPGNRTFIARPGDELFDVRIRQIRPDEVVFELKSPDGPAEPGEPREVIRPVRPAPGE